MGEPNSGDLPEWRSYSLSERPTMVITDDSHLASDPDAGERQLWEQVFYSG